MSKPCITCFPYRHYYDIYVSNVCFSSDRLIAMMELFPERRISALIECVSETSQVLSLITENTAMPAQIVQGSSLIIVASCTKAELCCLLKHSSDVVLEGLFIASVDDDKILDTLKVESMERIVNSMVKRGISTLSVSINFFENEILVSCCRAKYALSVIKETIRAIFC